MFTSTSPTPGEESPDPPVALVIAASDSANGAGIGADLKTMAALGVYATWAITAITAQNTHEVRKFFPMPTDLVVAQAEAVLDDLPVVAVKTGVLATAATVEAVADLARAGRLPHLVVDPVLLSSTGVPLFPPDATENYRRLLVPQAEVFTPNLLEASTLLGVEITTLADQREAARRLGAWGASVTIVKGGRAVLDRSEQAVDVVWDGTRLHELPAPRIKTDNNHGSGCSFASAVAAGLASGMTVGDSVDRAKKFVHDAIEGGATWALGAGHGPLDHFGWSWPEH